MTRREKLETEYLRALMTRDAKVQRKRLAREDRLASDALDRAQEAAVS